MLIFLAIAGCAAGPTPAPTATTLAEATPTQEPVEATPTPIVYVVKAGDTLGAIAKEYGVTVEALQEVNAIDDPRRLQIGQELIIPLGEEITTLKAWATVEAWTTPDLASTPPSGRFSGENDMVSIEVYDFEYQPMGDKKRVSFTFKAVNKDKTYGYGVSPENFALMDEEGELYFGEKNWGFGGVALMSNGGWCERKVDCILPANRTPLILFFDNEDIYVTRSNMPIRIDLVRRPGLKDIFGKETPTPRPTETTEGELRP